MYTVRFNGEPVLVDDEVAQEMGLSHGQAVGEDLFWKILERNCIQNIAQCRAALSKVDSR